MKIENIKINSFGKINDREYNLSEKINLIYGKNETGKSTLLKFIQNIFYGTSKNKKGKTFSDYDLYKPWGEGDFSGKIKYKLDSGKKFEVYREFGKKNPKIYNEKLEDISKEFNIDKNTGSEFFFEQTKVDEFMFLSSIVSMQQEVKLNKQDQNIYIQKIANLAGTGDDNISYKKAIDKLNKKQLDEIGTDRSQGKPINLSKNKINKYEEEIKELENYKQKKYIIENEINKLNNEVEKEKIKEKYLKELKERKEIEKIEIEKINFNKKIIEKNEELIKQKNKELNLLLIQKEKNNNLENNKKNSDLNNKTDINCINDINNKFKNDNINGINNEFKSDNTNNISNKLENKYKSSEKNKLDNKYEINNINKYKINNKIYFTVIIAFAILNIISFIITNNMIISLFLIIPIIITLFIYYKKINKIKKQNKKIEQKINKINYELNEKINYLKNEIKLLEKNNEEPKKEIEKINEKINSELNLEKQKIKNKYIYKIDNDELNILFNCIDFNEVIDNIQNLIRQKELDLNTLELNKKNIINNLEELVNLEELLELEKQNYDELKEKNDKINTARILLQEAYEKMKNSVTPIFTSNLSYNIMQISNGKYKKVTVTDEDGIIVELQNGEYVSAEKLSGGTIEQLYLSLRLSMVKEISNENMPIILDEAFAYYDDERLENTLRFLIDNFKENQIIMFTCTNREKEIFNRLNINYNLIQLDN